MAGSNSIYRSRQIKSGIALTLCTGATGLGLIFLVWILWTTLVNGLSALSLKLVTEMTPPPGEDGGLANAFAGSLHSGRHLPGRIQPRQEDRRGHPLHERHSAVGAVDHHRPVCL
jgi:hypothetical protein